MVVNNIIPYNVASNIMEDSEGLELKFVEECGERNDWPKGIIKITCECIWTSSLNT